MKSRKLQGACNLRNGEAAASLEYTKSEWRSRSSVDWGIAGEGPFRSKKIRKASTSSQSKSRCKNWQARNKTFLDHVSINNCPKKRKKKYTLKNNKKTLTYYCLRRPSSVTNGKLFLVKPNIEFVTLSFFLS